MWGGRCGVLTSSHDEGWLVKKMWEMGMVLIVGGRVRRMVEEMVLSNLDGVVRRLEGLSI